MERVFPEAMVTGHEPLIPSMTNDPKDRHVMAAAVRGRADVTVTSNVRDFPPEACEPYDVDVQAPDEFLQYQWEIGDPDFLLGVFDDWASHLTNPPLALEKLLQRLARRPAPQRDGTRSRQAKGFRKLSARRHGSVDQQSVKDISSES
jgi:hypothetical protein